MEFLPDISRRRGSYFWSSQSVVESQIPRQGAAIFSKMLQMAQLHRDRIEYRALLGGTEGS
jgi:hypothetical protein